jgi:hypothetical protein
MQSQYLSGTHFLICVTVTESIFKYINKYIKL